MKAYIKNGLWGKSKKISKGDLDLRRYIRDVLDQLKIAASDSCCSDFQSDSAPVRYNISGAEIEYYDVATKTWKAVV